MQGVFTYILIYMELSIKNIFVAGIIQKKSNQTRIKTGGINASYAKHFNYYWLDCMLSQSYEFLLHSNYNSRYCRSKNICAISKDLYKIRRSGTQLQYCQRLHLYVLFSIQWHARGLLAKLLLLNVYGLQTTIFNFDINLE